MQPNHDLHVHTHLSACCSDKANHRAANILERVRALGVETVGFADHVWENPGLPPNAWYKPQDAGQVAKLRGELAGLSFPGRILVGCEADTVGEGRFSITPAFAESLDYVLLACSHLHIRNLVEQPASPAPRAVADLLLKLFRSAAGSGLADIIPHPFLPCGYMESYDAIIAAIHDAEFEDAFSLAAAHGVALEITPASLPPEPGGSPGAAAWSLETPLRVLALARRAGCRFSLGTDAHAPAELDRLPRLLQFIEPLGLGPADFWLTHHPG